MKYLPISSQQKEICSELTIRHQSEANDVILVSILLSLNIFHNFFNVSIVDFKNVFVYWIMTKRLTLVQSR